MLLLQLLFISFVFAEDPIVLKCKDNNPCKPSGEETELIKLDDVCISIESCLETLTKMNQESKEMLKILGVSEKETNLFSKEK